MKNLLTVIFLGGSLVASAQNLIVQTNSRLLIGEGATVTTGGTVLNNGAVNADGTLEAGGDLDNTSTANIDIRSTGQLTLLEDALNDGVIINTGNISLGGNWRNNNQFNSIAGSITFIGMGMQTFFNQSTILRELIIDAMQTVELQGGRTEVDDLLDFRNGILTTTSPATLLVDNDADVQYDPSGISYFEGTLILEFGDEIGDPPSATREFPLGSNGRFGPIELSGIESSTGTKVEIGMTYISPNNTVPFPDDNVIGVSDRSLWRVEVVNGSIDDLDSATVFIEFFDENLTDFQEINDINADIKSPVVLESEQPGGIFTSLGVGDLSNTDSLSFGRITSEQKFAFDQNTKYIAIGLAPLVPDKIDIFIPQAFSPNSSDIRNQSFKLFGSGVNEEGFQMTIVNRFNKIMYETDSFEDAKTVGWDGGDEPADIYYYVVELTRDDGTDELLKGIFYLVR